MSLSSSTSACYGFDIGGYETKVAKYDSQTLPPECVVRSLTCVGFRGSERVIADNAAQIGSPFTHLLYLLSTSHALSEWLEFLNMSKYISNMATDFPQIQCDYHFRGEETTLVSSTQLLAMFLTRLILDYSISKKAVFAISVPSIFGQAEILALKVSLKIAGIDCGWLLTSQACIACYYGTLQPLRTNSSVLFIDIGDCITSIFSVNYTSHMTSSVITSTIRPFLGCRVIDEAIFNYVISYKKLDCADYIKSHARAYRRLMAECRSVMLSLASQSCITIAVDDLFGDGRLISCVISREEVEDTCIHLFNDVSQAIKAVIESSLLKGCDPFCDVHMLGGGARIQFVKQIVISSVDPWNINVSVSTDPTDCIAKGAAILASTYNPNNSNDISSVDDVCLVDDACIGLCGVPEGMDARIAKELSLERSMTSLDNECRLKYESRNNLESLYFEWHGLMEHGGSHSNLIDMAVLSSLLLHVECVLNNIDDSSQYDIDRVQQDFLLNIRRSFPLYFEAIKNDSLQRAVAAEVLKTKLQNEKIAEENNWCPEDDHDFRKLKTGDRLRKLENYRCEADALFANGKFEKAAQLYAKALSQTNLEKFIDLNPESQRVVEDFRVPLLLSMTICSLKAEEWDAVVALSTQIIEMDPECGKAYFRRAQANYAINRISDAEVDIHMALKFNPNDLVLLNLSKMINRASPEKKLKLRNRVYG